MATVDFNKPFDKKKLSFGALKKLDQGGVINITYDGNKIVMRTDKFLQAPYGISLPYSQRTKNGGGAADAAPAGKGESNKCSIDVSLDAAQSPKMHAWIVALQDACIEYIKNNGSAIFGLEGLNMKKGALAEKLAELAAGTTKIYKLLKTNDDGYPPKLCIKFPNNSDLVTIVNTKNQLMKHTDVGKGSMVTVLFAVSGIFVNGLMATIQTQAQAICARGSAALDTSKIFEDVLDADAEASPEASPVAKRKREDDGGDGYPAALTLE